MKNEEDMLKNLSELTDEDSFSVVFTRAFKCLFIKNNNYLFLFIIQMLLLPIIFVIVHSDNTLNSVYSIVNLLFTLVVALFGIFFTGYAIFQAFMSRKLTVALLGNSGQKRGMFSEYNLFFFSMCILYLFILIFDLITLIYLENYGALINIIPINIMSNSFLVFIIVNLVTSLHIFAFIEVKSLIYNIYQAFNSSAIIIGIDELEGKKE